MTTDPSKKIKPNRVEENVNPMIIAGLKREYTFGKEMMNISTQWTEFSAYFCSIPGQKENVAYGLCIDRKNGNGFEYVCGVEISEEMDASELPEGLELKQLPSFSYAVFEHNGHVSTIRQTCDAIFHQWIPDTDFRKPENANFFFERYGQEFDPGKGLGGMEIWIPVDK